MRKAKAVNLYEDIYQIAKEFINEQNSKIGYERTFRSMAQLVEEAIMFYAIQKGYN